MKSALVSPRFGPLTQGTIFSCAVAEDYAECRTYGFIITARCDVAHDKARTYNYVPIVNLNDWLHRDGRILLGERLRSETVGKLKDALKEAGFSPSILETEPPRSVLTTLFPLTGASSKAAKVRIRFDELCRRYELAVRSIESDPSMRTCIVLANSAPKLRDKMIEELTSHRLVGYYFLDQIEPDGDDMGYVALLREVQLMPRLLAHAIGAGLDVRLFSQMCDADPAMRGRLRIPTGDLAMPIAVVASPNVEHFIQSFSLLFGRVGIDNIELSYVATLWGRQPDMKGAN
jgi:hypothetical protein